MVGRPRVDFHPANGIGYERPVRRFLASAMIVLAALGHASS
jgi:hypothetical protein